MGSSSSAIRRELPPGWNNLAQQSRGCARGATGMNSESPSDPAVRSFLAALIRHKAPGYVVCVKPLRFAKLQDEVVTSFAEMRRDGCYYLFETEEQARRALADLSPSERQGHLFSIKEVFLLHRHEAREVPLLDVDGHPFGRRGFLVAKNGAMLEWTRPGRLGWRDLGGEENPPSALSLRSDGRGAGTGSPPKVSQVTKVTWARVKR